MNILVPCIIGAVIGSMIRKRRKQNNFKKDLNLKEEIKLTPTTRVSNTNNIHNNLPSSVKTICNNIERELRSKDLSAYHNNIKNLKITNKLDFFDKNFRLNKMIYISLYYPKENKIYVSDRCDQYSLSHEMLHLSSTRVEGNNIFTGFNQITHGRTYGVGLNEGYTELLTSRYFSDKMSHSSYLIEQAYAGITEMLVGRYKMEDLYFKSDLNGLVNALTSYYSFNDVTKYIKSIDIISKASNFGESSVDRKTLDYAMLFANTFAMNALEEKIRRSGNNPEVMYKAKSLLRKALTGSINMSLRDSETRDQLMIMHNNLQFMEPVKQRVYSKTR